MLIKHKNGYHYDWCPEDSVETKPVGSFDLFVNKYNPQAPMELWSFGIHKEDDYNKGYGQQMLKEAIAVAGDHDIKLFVYRTNNPAIHIYKKAGFVRTDERREDAFIWSMIRYNNVGCSEKKICSVA